VLTGVGVDVTAGVGVTFGLRVGLGVITGDWLGVGVASVSLQCLLWVLGLSVTSSLQGLKSFLS
jgi:hypothetical protein